MYQVELTWNREFNFISYGKPIASLTGTIAYANELLNRGNGASVKKIKVV